MSQTDYRDSLAYINNYYSKHQIGGETDTKDKVNIEDQSPLPSKTPAPAEITKFDQEDDEALPIHLKKRKKQ